MLAAPGGRERGFTLLELMIVVAIVGILASVGVPQYMSALRIARVGKARQELVTISQAIDSYTANHQGQLPLTLHQVGFGGKRDPWGVPYCYLNYADGTGDGLQWAIDAGLVDPSALKQASTTSGGSGGATTVGPRRGSFGFVTASWRRPQGAVAVASADNLTVATEIAAALPRTVTTHEIEELAAALGTASATGVYAGVPTEVTRRRDQFLFPLNTDYDLFSLGPNASTAVAIGEALAQDDVIRANNGGFFGLASEY